MKSPDLLPRILSLLLLAMTTPVSGPGQEPDKQALPSPAGQTQDPITLLRCKGVTFPVSYTAEVLGNLSGGYRRGAIFGGVLQLGMQIDLEKFAGWKGATLLVSGLYPHGSSLTSEYVHDFNGVSNIDANDSVRLYEVWLQQDFGDGKFSIRVGQILADTEFFISNNASVFINSAFGTIPLVSLNLNPPLYPIAAPGVRLRFTPDNAWSFQFGAFDGDVGNPVGDNRHGTRFDLNRRDGALLVGELSYTFHPPPKPDGVDAGKQIRNERPLSGTFKLGGFYHTADRASADGDGLHQGDCGFYAIVDQEIWHKPGDPDGGLECFAHIGGAPDNRNIVSFYCDGGLDYQGLLPSREKDILGIGFSYTKISDDLLKNGGLPVVSHHETVVEATYLAVINDWLSVQPDFQCILNPGATSTLPAALVAGVRININF